MRILGRKFYAYKSKNRRKNTPDSAFPRTLFTLSDAGLSGSVEYRIYSPTEDQEVVVCKKKKKKICHGCERQIEKFVPLDHSLTSHGKPCDGRQ